MEKVVPNLRIVPSAARTQQLSCALGPPDGVVPLQVYGPYLSEAHSVVMEKEVMKTKSLSVRGSCRTELTEPL